MKWMCHQSCLQVMVIRCHSCRVQELQEVGASQNPKLKELQDRLGKALVELQASKEEDGIVVSRQHKDGSAFKSGRISNGDILAKVDGTAIGQ